MTQVVSDDVSAIQPELWSTMVQVPLYKRLVALDVANLRFSDTVKNADIIHIPYFGSLSAQTYTPGTTLSATNQEWDYDTLTVSTYKHCTVYVDNPEALTVNIDQARELAGEAAYQLANAIDTDVLSQITGAHGFTCADAEDLQGGTNLRPVSAGSAAIINIFTNARKVLRQGNVEEDGNWCAIVTPQIAQYIEVKAANVGYNVADATLRNGYAGDFLGFQVYISNNLPSGKCSAIAPTAKSGVGTGPVSATSCKSIYFGRKGTIDVILMKAPALEIRQKSDMIGSNFITWTVYGQGVLTKNQSRGRNVPVQSGYY